MDARAGPAPLDGAFLTGRYAEALALIDAVHAEDPARDAAGLPAELAYARRMSEWLERLAPEASEALKLAVRCQHLKRWAIPRSRFPEGRVGYLSWRKEEARAHAALAAELLGRAGYDAAAVARVRALVMKEAIKHDPEAQAVEDATCLAFLELDFAGFAAKHPEEKLVDILRKTWAKMSPPGRHAALGLALEPRLRKLVEQALS